MAKITPELYKLLSEADTALAKAMDAKEAVHHYLEHHYKIDDECFDNIIEDNFTWCYGIDEKKLEKYLAGTQEQENPAK